MSERDSETIVDRLRRYSTEIDIPPEVRHAMATAAVLLGESEHGGGLRPGLYKHTKGGLYTAHGLVTHHETRMPMVLYTSHQYGGYTARPLRGWVTHVDGRTRCMDPDGWNDEVYTIGSNPTKGSRFTFIGDLPSDTKITER